MYIIITPEEVVRSVVVQCYNYVDKDFLSITQAPGMLENDYKRSTRIQPFVNPYPWYHEDVIRLWIHKGWLGKHWIKI